jgi:hypothetical protein
MTVSFAVLPLAAAAARSVVHQVGDTLRAGLSFADVLSAHDNTTPPPNQSPATKEQAEGSPPLTNESQSVRWRAAWQQIQLQTQSLQQVLVEQFAAHGVDLSEPIVLTTDANGRVLAADGHLDRGKIEQLLEANPALTAQLRELFQQVASLQASSGAGGTPQIDDVRLVLDQRQAFFAGSPDAADWT